MIFRSFVVAVLVVFAAATGTVRKPRKPADEKVLQLVGVEDAAARLGTSVKHVRRLVATKELFSVKLGRRRLIPSYVLDEYIRAVIEAEDDQAS